MKLIFTVSRDVDNIYALTSVKLGIFCKDVPRTAWIYNAYTPGVNKGKWSENYVVSKS